MDEKVKKENCYKGNKQSVLWCLASGNGRAGAVFEAPGRGQGRVIYIVNYTGSKDLSEKTGIYADGMSEKR